MVRWRIHNPPVGWQCNWEGPARHADAAAPERQGQAAHADEPPASAGWRLLDNRSIGLPGPHDQEADARRAGLQGTVGGAGGDLEDGARGTGAAADGDRAFKDVD